MNLSILDRNVTHALGAADCPDELVTTYLLARDRLPPERAEAAAWQWARVCRVVIPALASATTPDNAAEALAFIRSRFLNMDQNR